jgi:hypothetical protein
MCRVRAVPCDCLGSSVATLYKLAVEDGICTFNIISYQVEETNRVASHSFYFLPHRRQSPSL